jgi:hypothetical protein
MKSGSSISINDLYLAVPRLENQLSAREFIEKSNILNDKRKDDPLLFIDIA